MTLGGFVDYQDEGSSMSMNTNIAQKPIDFNVFVSLLTVLRSIFY